MWIRTVAIVIVVLAALGAARVWLGGDFQDLRAVPTAGADAHIDRALGDADFARLQPKIERSVTYVEELFERKFAVRPKILLFATRAAFANGLTDIFDYSEGSATLIATHHGGIFDRATSTIMLSLESIGSYGIAPVLEHELTHQIVREASAMQHLPTWFEEGIATLAERRPDGSRWAEQDALVGRAIASLRRATFTRSETLDGWQALDAGVGENMYAYAAQALTLIRSRVAWSGVLDLLQNVAAGQTLADAYQKMSGETLAAIEARLAVVEPAIISRPSASGTEWTLSTGQARAPVDVTIAGPSTYTVHFTVTTDEFGMYRGSFGSTAAPGTYFVSASGARAELNTERR